MMSKQNLFSGLIGLILGAVIVSFIKFNHNNSDYTYFELMENVDVGEMGSLKKGVVLRYDDSFPEGFTRFILYLNVKGLDMKEVKQTRDNVIIPYWIESNESE